MFTHIVLFKLKDASDAAELRRRLLALKDDISELLHIEVGIDELGSPRSCDLSLLTRFESRSHMERYQAHPAHQAFLAYARERLERTHAVDYSD